MDITTLEEKVRAQQAEIESLRSTLAKQERENKRLTDELTVLLNRLFRPKSERLDPAHAKHAHHLGLSQLSAGRLRRDRRQSLAGVYAASQ